MTDELNTRLDRSELEARKRLARGVLASLDGIGARTLRMLAAGVSLADEPLCGLAQPLHNHAIDIEHEAVPGQLTELVMARALRLIANHPDCPELLDRLEDMKGRPWLALRAALEETMRVESQEW